MLMREGDRWICSNPSCKCEILVLLSSNVPYGDHPVCACGHRMKKAYIAPQLRTIRNPEDLRALQEKFSAKVR